MRATKNHVNLLSLERSSTSAPAGYRPDIDGLRSLAVSAVVLFHAGLTALPGGYVGVDVFFVISGYLITRQVMLAAERSRFSFVEFYTRRVRRLLPAALATAAATLLIAWLIVPAFRLAEIARSVAAAVLSVSNIFFWQGTSYWADESAVQPLLHTWSLSVEEQFYLVWPFLIYFSLKWFKRATLSILIAGTLLSVAVTVWATHHSPDAAFYLTPFRTYEFALGAICVWIDRVPWRDSRPARALQSTTWLIGIAMIVYAMFTYNESGTAFPGWQALIPTVGTALVIIARQPKILGRVLDNRLMMYIGLRSYSIYLVHWPVLVFALEFIAAPSISSAVICLALTVILAEIQYRFVERPLRVHSPNREGRSLSVPTRAPSARRRFVRLAGPVIATALVIAGAGVTTSVYASSPAIYPSEIRAVATIDKESINSVRRAARDEICEVRDEGGMYGTLSTTSANVLVIGDSYGVDGLNISKVIAPDANYLVSERAGCPPFYTEEHGSECTRLNSYRLSKIDEMAAQVDLVVLSMKIDSDNYLQAMERVTEIVNMGVTVVVIGQAAHYKQETWQTILEHGGLNGVGGALYRELDVSAEENDRLKNDVTKIGAEYIDRWDWMCTEGECKGFTESGSDLIIFDTAHMTLQGANEFAESVKHDPSVQRAYAAALE